MTSQPPCSIRSSAMTVQFQNFPIWPKGRIADGGETPSPSSQPLPARGEVFLSSAGRRSSVILRTLPDAHTLPAEVQLIHPGPPCLVARMSSIQPSGSTGRSAARAKADRSPRTNCTLVPGATGGPTHLKNPRHREPRRPAQRELTVPGSRTNSPQAVPIGQQPAATFRPNISPGAISPA